MASFSAHTPDTELTAAIKASDHTAFKALYYRYFEALFRFLWRQTGDRELAKDLLQETFSRIWKNRANLDPRQSIKSYLYRISHNLVIDHRRQYKQALDSLDSHPEIAPAYSPDEQFDLHDKIHQAIKSLPEPVRLVFTMNRFDGIKYLEIAAALNISVKTVEARMSKALALLREKLAPFLMVLLLGMTYTLHLSPGTNRMPHTKKSFIHLPLYGKNSINPDRVFTALHVLSHRTHNDTESAILES